MKQLLPWVMVAGLLAGTPGCELETAAVLPGRPATPSGPSLDDAATNDASDAGEIWDDSAVTVPTPDADPAPPPADAGPADASPADASAPEEDSAMTGPPPTCDELYGEANGYTLCAQSEDECMFYVRLGGDRSCDDVCAASGALSGVCLRTHHNHNSSGQRCTTSGSEDCDANDLEDHICVCNRPQ